MSANEGLVPFDLPIVTGALNTFWVDGVQVDKATYVAAERSSGFRNTQGQPDEPATSQWGGVGVDAEYHTGHQGFLHAWGSSRIPPIPISVSPSRIAAEAVGRLLDTLAPLFAEPNDDGRAPLFVNSRAWEFDGFDVHAGVYFAQLREDYTAAREALG